MTDFKHIIEPERIGLWVAASFALALLALVVAIVAIQRNAELAVVTQSEVMMLNQKIVENQPASAAEAPAAEVK